MVSVRQSSQAAGLAYIVLLVPWWACPFGPRSDESATVETRVGSVRQTQSLPATERGPTRSRRAFRSCLLLAAAPGEQRERDEGRATTTAGTTPPTEVSTPPHRSLDSTATRSIPLARHGPVSRRGTSLVVSLADPAPTACAWSASTPICSRGLRPTCRRSKTANSTSEGTRSPP